MILKQALQSATRTLLKAGIPDAHVEAEILLGSVLRMSKAQLYTEPEKDLSQAEVEHLRCFVERRLNREPTPYILRRCEFFGIDLYIDHRTFIPRPETEVLVEEAIKFAHFLAQQREQVKIADIGTGCGAIAISLALAFPQVEVYATDISVLALQVAEINCRRHGVDGRVRLLQGNLLEPLPQVVDVLVANLPYVRDCEFDDMSPEITNFEPMIALAGGEDGLDKIHQMLEQIPGRLSSGGAFLLEIGQGQAEAVISLVRNHFPRASIRLISDLGGIDRVVQVVL